VTARDLPAGTVTFLFTDIEGSTKLLQSLGDRYPPLLAEHHRILLEAVEAAGGRRVNTEGDAVFAVFASAPAATEAAVAAQRALETHPWPEDARIHVRMGLHTGLGTQSGQDYVGIDVHRAARIAAAGHGGQVLLSDATRGVVDHHLPDGISLLDLGEHRLKDLEQPEHLYQLAATGLRSTFPPLRSLDLRPNNLPSLLTSFIGRREELAEAVRLIGASRLVTLTGPGGTGKTRLSLAAAAALLPDFADGVFFVPLASITDPALVPPSIALALGVQEAGESPVMDMLREHLRSRRLLLVLDNFEQIMDAAPVVADLLAAAPELHVVVTSRERLHLSGEQEYPVPPLGLPDPANLPPLDALSQFDAVALFVQRARTSNPAFAVTNDNAPSVAEICVRLDGLPLAIELAAARIKLFPPETLLRRLGDRLAVLQGGARDLPERQRTLRGAIDWSFDLLEPDERTLFARLGVFAGGCTYEAADAVVGPDPADDANHRGIWDVLEGIESLLDKSLLRQAEPGSGEPRVWMLETIREYAAERLEESGEGPAMRARHGRFFADLAEEAEPRFTGEEQVAWLDRIEREHDNLRAALRRAIDVGSSDVALRTASALWRFWQLRGHLSEGRSWLTEVLAEPDASEPTALRARALSALAGIAYWQTDYAAAAPAYEEALEIDRATGDRPGEAWALYSLAYLAGVEGEFERARELAAESGRIATSLGDELGAANAQHLVGAMAGHLLHYEEGLADSLAAAETFRALGERFGLGNARQIQSAMYRETGRFEEARAASEEAIEIFRAAGSVSATAMGLGGMASLMIAEGRVEDGVRVAGAADAMEESAGGRAPSALRGYDDARDQARALLDGAALAAAWDAGRAMSFDEAMALVRAGR
jgi:predicted ATPase/class 3 adenylate cyclase